MRSPSTVGFPHPAREGSFEISSRSLIENLKMREAGLDRLEGLLQSVEEGSDESGRESAGEEVEGSAPIKPAEGGLSLRVLLIIDAQEFGSDGSLLERTSSTQALTASEETAD